MVTTEPAATTEFHDDQSLDLPSTAKHLDAMIRAGVHGMIVLGTVVLLAGCAGREANPEPTQWAYDKYYTCQDIRAEKDRILKAGLDIKKLNAITEAKKRTPKMVMRRPRLRGFPR